jgi:hypothetical protein
LNSPRSKSGRTKKNLKKKKKRKKIRKYLYQIPHFTHVICVRREVKPLRALESRRRAGTARGGTAEEDAGTGDGAGDDGEGGGLGKFHIFSSLQERKVKKKIER